MIYYQNTNAAEKAIVSIPGWAEAMIRGEIGEGKINSAQAAYAHVPLIFRAVQIRCDSLASVPLHLYKGDTEQVWKIPIVGPDKQEMDLHELIWKTESSLLLEGAAYWLKLANTVRIQGLQWLNPLEMKVKFEELTDDKGKKQETLIFEQGERNRWTGDRMVYFKEYNPSDDIQPGVAATKVALGDAGLLKYMTQFSSRFFEGGAMPVMLLGVSGAASKEELDRVQNFFKKAVLGVKNAFRVLAFRADAIVPTQMTPPMKDLAVPELNERARHNVSVAFGIPQSMLEDAANYATAKEHRISFWQDTVRARGRSLERFINQQLLKQFNLRLEFAFDEMDVFQEDETRRSAAYYNYVQAQMKPSIAAQILGIDLPQGVKPEDLDVAFMRNVEDEPIDSEGSPRKAIIDELRKWMRFELNRLGKSSKREFEPEYISDTLTSAIRGSLEKAKDEKSIRRIFMSAETWENYP